MESVSKPIHFISEPQSVSMGDDWFKFSYENHFWLSWRFQVTLRALKKIIRPSMKLAEIGCGHSIFRNQFEKIYSMPVDGFELNLHALSMGDPGMGERYIYDVTARNAELKEKYDVLFIMDVLEHIPQDHSFLEDCLFMLKPGGYVVINVPYSKLLYSQFDQAAGHVRRYNKKAMHGLLRASKLTPLKVLTWGFFLFPIAVLRKVYINLFKPQNIIEAGFQPPNQWVHSFLRLLMKFELLMPFHFFLGTSLFAVARKK